ncbi:MAG: phage holin family protein [Actinobacteria bacterium]|nr:MAG: phage holin family protein [Actinomycetota bacterium]
MRLLTRWFISGLSLFLAAWLVPGITVAGEGWIVYAIMAVILGLLNAIVRPIVKFFSIPALILTFGLFILVINALMLWLASSVATNIFGVGFYVDSFKDAFWGSLIITIVTALLSGLVKEKDND